MRQSQKLNWYVILFLVFFNQAVFTDISKSLKKTKLSWRKFWLETKEKYTTEKESEKDLALLYMLASFCKDSSEKEIIPSVFAEMRRIDKNFVTHDIMIRHYFDQGDIYKICASPLFSEFNPANLDREILLMAACAFEFAGNSKEADKYFDYLETNFPDEEAIVHKSVVRMISKKEFSKALAKIDTFLSKSNLRPKHTVFFLIKAQLLFEVLHDLKGALAAINQGLELTSRVPSLLQLKLVLLQKLEEKDEFVETLQEFVNLTGEESLRKNLIGIYLQSGQDEKAFEEMSHFSISSPEILFDKIILATKLNKTEQALELLEEYLKYDKKNCKVSQLQKCLLFKAGKFDKMAKILLKEMNSKNKNQSFKACTDLLSILEHCSKQGKIIAKLHQKIINSKKEILKMALLDKCLQLGFLAYAYDLSLELEPIVEKNIILHAKLLCANAKACSELGLVKKSELLLDLALKKCPDLVCAWKLKADFLAKKGCLNNALKCCNKAIRFSPTDKGLICFKNKLLLQNPRFSNKHFSNKLKSVYFRGILNNLSSLQ